MGLVLTGGGARAAYQAGALKGLCEVLKLKHGASPFKVVTGISAGAINGAHIAAESDRFIDAVEELHSLWSDLRSSDVMLTDASSLSGLALRWLWDLGFGGVAGGGHSTFLLDTAPLRRLLRERLNIGRVKNHVQSGQLFGVSFSATNYKTGTAISFFDGDSSITPWVRSSRLGKRDTLTIDHVMASAAIPVLFPPVKIHDTYFGDGSIRLSTPLSPAIHLGSDRIFAIGIRYNRPLSMTLELNAVQNATDVSLADIAGVVMNASFFDTLDADIERLERINTTLSILTPEQRRANPNPLRPVPLYVLRPSVDLGALAAAQFENFPVMLRHLLTGIGASRAQGSDLLSYLAFEPSYTQKVMALAHKDVLEKADEIRAFFS